ncbi:MAG: M48 family metalloprotease [Candidatus Brockarchaeota archaeon]|nr:M48 family metalloprotease [Candidatus Brockarchaeota archaeon]
MLSIDLNYILIQLFQPYFYYSTTLLVVSFICVKALVKFNPLLTAKVKSLCYLFPLTIPVLLVALTSPWFITRLLLEIKVSSNPHKILLATPLNPRIAELPPPIVFNHVKLLDNPSVANMLLAAGLTLSLFYLFTIIALNDRVARRVFQIVELEPSEYESLQKKVGELSKKLGINPPRIGLVEDLRPNAFTVGYGRRTMLVFSLGILQTLNERELAAVTAHELAHVKNNDFLFKTVSVSLTLLSFFNPFAYFASATAQREREILADEEGAQILRQPGLLAKTLVKIYEASREFPKESIITRLASGLFLSYPISVRSMMLFSTHPRLDQRIENIRRLNRRGEAARISPLLSATVSILIIAAGIISTYYITSIRSFFIRQYFPTILFNTPLEGKRLIPAYCLDSAWKTRVPGFFRFRNVSPNDLNELHFRVVVLWIEEGCPNHHPADEPRLNIYSLKVKV